MISLKATALPPAPPAKGEENDSIFVLFVPFVVQTEMINTKSAKGPFLFPAREGLSPVTVHCPQFSSLFVQKYSTVFWRRSGSIRAC